MICFYRRRTGNNQTQTGAHMERMGATASREAMRMPISQIPAVSSKAQVGSPLAFPWPNTYDRTDAKRVVTVNPNYNQESSERVNVCVQPAGKGQCRLSRWPAGAEERRSSSADPRRSRRRTSQSQWPRARARRECRWPGSLSLNHQTCSRKQALSACFVFYFFTLNDRNN